MSWTEAEALLAQRLPGYESRPEQRRLAETIETALGDGEHLAAQAGTGTGKSLANLIPAIYRAKETGKAVIVSTATKALQSQYAGKDVPFLSEHLDVDFTGVLLKGRSNYLCLAKLNELAPDSVFNQDALKQEMLTEDFVGDIEDTITELDMRDKPKLTSSSDECPGKNDCPFGEICYAEKAKQRAAEADLVIVNHAMLATDLKIWEKTEGKVSVLPEFGAVVVDEAHELEEYATSALGTEFTQKSLTGAAVEAANFVGKDAADAVSVLNARSAQLFKALERFLGRERTRSVDEHALLQHQDVLIGTLDAIEAIGTEVRDVRVFGDDKKAQRKKRLTRRFDSLAEKFREILLSEGDELVRWVERDDKRGTILKTAPLHVGPFLRENLWSRVPGVLLSATLAVGSDFSYITGRLGIDSYRSFDAGTPFNFPKQSALFVPGGFDPSGDKMGWQMKVQESMKQLITAAGGRALLLFTSNQAKEQAHQALAPYLRKQGLTVLKQGEQPNRVLTETFKNDETSVLFAVKSFMTGIDVQGDALRLVVIDKLPFAVPSDVINKARCDAIDDSINPRDKWTKGSFTTLTVPSMALTLLQAFGRLIRTKQDEGLVAIFDSRLLTKKYGKTMLKAMPPARRIQDLGDAVAYLDEVTERRA